MKRLAILLAAVIALGGCTRMTIDDFAGTRPRLVLEEYFAGEMRAYGFFADRFGTVRRQFMVDITGTPTADGIRLDEHFLYDDGEVDRRVWDITRTGPDTYTGEADDVVGKARGTIQGNALNWRYTMDLPVGDNVWRVRFDDWMFLQPDGVLLNRATVSKWGVDIGTIYISFIKRSAERAPPIAAE